MKKILANVKNVKLQEKTLKLTIFLFYVSFSFFSWDDQFKEDFPWIIIVYRQQISTF